MSDRYNGYENWETWNTVMILSSYEELYQRVIDLIENHGSIEDLRDFAIVNAIAPHNREVMEGAKEWNSFPVEERLDSNFEALPPRAKEVLYSLGIGPDVDDVEPNIIDPWEVNWQEVYNFFTEE